VHGANRLASNSLLEGMVFGPRVIEAIGQGVNGPVATGAMRAVLTGWPPGGAIGGRRVSHRAEPAARPASGDAPTLRSLLQRTMTRCAGVLRTATSLDEAQQTVATVHAGTLRLEPSPAVHELLNLVAVASAVLASALTREETRGCHTREDFPDTSEEFRLRLVV